MMDKSTDYEQNKKYIFFDNLASHKYDAPNEDINQVKIHYSGIKNIV